MSDISKETVIKMTLLPVSGENKSKNMYTSPATPNCKQFFSNPIEAKWPDTPFLPSNTFSITSKVPPKSLSNIESVLTSDCSETWKPEDTGVRKINMNSDALCEKRFDTNLVSLVKSVKVSKNLDSDSSNDAVLSSRSNNNISISNRKRLNNSQVSETLSTLLKNKKGSSAYSQNIPGNNLNSQKNNRSVNSPFHPPSLSLLKEALAKNSAQPSFSNPVNFSNNLSFSTNAANSVVKCNVTKQVPLSKQESFLSKSQLISNLLNSKKNVKTCKFPSVPNKLESNPINQAIYASMGLDEDLCDLKTKKSEEKVASSSMSEEPASNKSLGFCQDFLSVSIKTEIDATPPTSPGKDRNKIHNVHVSPQNLTSNDVHVSMTFETDPYDDDDLEDDLPLSFLKARAIDENTSEANKSNVAPVTTLNNFEKPILIKKELIEDEIASEGSVLHSKTFAYGSSNVNLESSGPKGSFVSVGSLVSKPVEIKTEPNTELESCDSTLLKPCAESLLHIPTNDSIVKKVPPCKRSKKQIKKNIKHSDGPAFNLLNNTITMFPNKNLTSENLSKMCEMNANICCNPSGMIETNVKNYLDNAVSKVNLSTDASVYSSNSHTPCIGPENLTHLSSSSSKTKRKIEEESKIDTSSNGNCGINSKKPPKVPEQLSSITHINKSVIEAETHIPDFAGNSDFSAESIAPKIKNKKKKNVKRSATQDHLEIPPANIAENSDISSSESTASKKKGKKKLAEKSANVDYENLPITLLIKRRKTDPNIDDSETFLCTSVNKLGNNSNKRDLIGENLKSDSSISNFNQSLNHNLSPVKNSEVTNAKEQLPEMVEPLSINIENSSIKKKSAKKKRNSPKRPAKKKGKKNILNNKEPNKASETSNNLLVSHEIVTNPKESESSSGEKNITIASNLIKETSPSPVAPKRKNSNTIVYMSFEEQNSPVDEASEDYLKSILSIKKELDQPLHSNNAVQAIDTLSIVKNIKKENDFSSNLESETIEQIKIVISDEKQPSLFSSPTPSTSSELISSNQPTPNDSVHTTSNSVSTNSPKKKKKRPKSFGWYKRKKQRSKVTTSSKVTLKDASSSVVLSDAIVPLPIIEVNHEDATIKTPVVVIKNLLDPDKVAVYNDEKILEDNVAVHDVVTPVKKCKKKASKRKRTSKSKSRKKKLQLETIQSDDKVLDNKPENGIVVSEISAVPVTNNFENLPAVSNIGKSSLFRSASEETLVDMELSDIAQDKNNSHEVIDISDSPTKPTCRINIHKTFSKPTLNVAEIAKEIAGLETMVQSHEKSYLMAENKVIQEKESMHKCTSHIMSNMSVQNSNGGNLISSSLSGDLLFGSRNENPHTQVGESANKSTFCTSLITVKKEVEDDCEIIEPKNAAQARSSNTLLNSCNSLSTVQDCLLGKTQKIDSQCTTTIKKEVSTSNYSSVEFSNSVSTSDTNRSHLVPGSFTVARNEPTNILNDFQILSSSVNSSTASSKNLLECTQSNSMSISDQLALSIKKEITDAAKSGSFEYTSQNAIRNQNTLIEKVAEIQTNLEFNASNALHNAEKSINSSSLQIDLSETSELHSSTGNVTDDEIQVLEIGTEKSKCVPCVDLTDENISVAKEHEDKVSASDGKNLPDKQFHLESLHAKNLNDSTCALLYTDVLSSKKIASVLNNNELLVRNRLNSESPSVSERDKVSPFLYNKAYDLSGFEEDLFPPSNKTTTDPLIFRQKYTDEYFKYPFPSSLVAFSCKPRNKHKVYSRINSQSLNLSIEKVESRLKNSEIIKSQFGNKLGDIVKLNKYSVSTSEVECYHRILGVAPSHKLLSKCFKSSDKSIGTILNNTFSVFSETQKPTSLFKFENNQQNLSLNDIIQGISECKKLSGIPDSENISEVFSRDCPSTNTIDSCDSHISNLSDKIVNAIHRKDPNNMDIIKDTAELLHVYQDASSSGRNSVLSCPASDYQDSSKSCVANADFCAEKSVEGLYANNLDINEAPCSQNVFSFLKLPNSFKLPSREVLDSIVNNNQSDKLLSRNLSTPHILSDSNGSTLPAPDSSPRDLHTELNTNMEANAAQSLTNPMFNIDLPVTELRKILEVAGNIHSDENLSESNMWKSKATFEYNHTRSVPIEEKSSKHDLENIADHMSLNVSTTSVEKKNSTVTTKDNCFDDNDDDYVDNEGINCETDFDQNETADSKEKDTDDPIIPQYKSRWEKIMERKSLESKEKEPINKHLLKDCFPVSSKMPSKKCNMPDETTIKSIHKKVEKLKVKENTSKPETDVKHIDSKKPQSEISKKKSKADIYSDTKTKVSNKMSNNLMVKNKGKNVDDVKQKDSKKVSTKLDVKNKNKGKRASVGDATLFAPDIPVKSADEKKESLKSNDSNSSKRFYGNRVTNRGTFLTNISASEALKKIKIPKKKISEETKKCGYVRSEEFHSMVKSPDINIEPRRFNSSYKTAHHTKQCNSYNKNKKEFYKRSSSLHSNSSKSSYLPEKEKLQDRRASFSNRPTDVFHHPYQDNRKFPVVNTIPVLSQPRNDSNPYHNEPLLDIPSFHPNTESIPVRVSCRSTSVSTPAVSLHSRDESLPNRRVSHQNIPPSSSFEYPLTRSYSSEQTPPMAMLQQIISSVNMNNSPIAAKDGTLPFSDYLNPTWNNTQLSSFNQGFKELPTFSDQSDSMSNSFSTSASYASDLPLALKTQNSIPSRSASHISFQHQIDTAFKAKGLIGEPANSNSMPGEILKKATCLVPQHLKSLVGNKIIETSNVRLLMLEWSVDWLMQQQKNQDPPPISNGLKKVVSSYDSFEDYYNTYFPLMLLDTWHRIYVSWTHLSQTSPYCCEIISYSVKSTFVSIECQTVFNKTAHAKGVFPDEGSILMIKYSTKSKNFAIKILGYVTHVKTRHFNPVTDSKLCNYKPPKDGNFEVLQVLTLTFMGAYNSEDIDKRLPIRIHVLCNVKSALKQNDALLYISKSPLQAIILNPIEDGLLNVALTPRNSPQDKINECVRDITKGILSPHPLPLLTIVRAMPESDRLNIIPLLIEKMKSTYKTKVLLCVRTVRALGDIAANICLRDSLKLVIINKRCDTNIQFQRYLLDELVITEMNKIEPQSVPERPHLKNETISRTKKQIFRDCDVILSLIRNCHDEFMETTFTETESVAQMCCIVDEANLCTEPETLIPILHGISKLILIGDPDYFAKVLSKTAKEYDYHRSFFHRAYDLDSITE